MSSRPTEPFRREHEQLLDHIEHIRIAAAEMPELSPQERRVVVDRVLEFLVGTLVPHAQAEEAVLYPEWATLVGYRNAADAMIHDHNEIVRRIERLGAASMDDAATLQELLYGLHALVLVHFRKEEDIQLPIFDEQPQEVVDRVLSRMAEHEGNAHSKS